MLDQIRCLFRSRRVDQTAPPQMIPKYQAAIEGGDASFGLLTELRQELKSATEDEKRQAALAWYYRRAYEIFRCKHGGFVEFYMRERDGAAIALTERHRFFSHYCITLDTYTNRLLLLCDRRATEAGRLLRGNDLKACNEVLYSSAKTLLCIKASKPKQLNGQMKGDGKNNYCLKLVKEHLAYAHDFHLRAARLLAERYYALGMGMGILIGLILWVLGATLLTSEMLTNAFFAVMIGGGLGAAISAMWRMTRRNLNVNVEDGRLALVLVGGFRPLIGAVFGLVVYALIQSGLLAFAVPAGASDLPALYFYGVIGFLSGFSERWAPNLLRLAEGRLSSEVASDSSQTFYEDTTESGQSFELQVTVNGNNTPVLS